jgi:hypothetical protein
MLEISGAIQRNPKRYLDRVNEPQVDAGIGQPPNSLSVQEQKIWKEISNDVSWLKVTDRLSLEMVCRLVAKLRDGSIKIMEMSALITTLRCLGLTPADRSRVNVSPTTNHKNEWISLLNTDVELR